MLQKRFKVKDVKIEDDYDLNGTNTDLFGKIGFHYKFFFSNIPI